MGKHDDFTMAPFSVSTSLQHFPSGKISISFQLSRIPFICPKPLLQMDSQETDDKACEKRRLDVMD